MIEDNKEKKSKKSGSKSRKEHLKIEQMRKKYKKLFYNGNEVEKETPKKLKKEEREKINSVITGIEEMVTEIQGAQETKRTKIVESILLKLEKLINYELTVEQAEKLYSLLQKVKSIKDNRMEKARIYQDGRKLVNKISEAINVEQSQTEEVEELKSLGKRLTAKMQQDNPIAVASVKDRIERKISKINYQKAIDRIRNDIPASIDLIIKEIAKGTLDIEKAKQIIEKEAQRRVESKPKTKFTLTEEQEKKQILIQIKTALKENGEKYHIENPKGAVIQIQELCGESIEQSIKIVVENLISRKDFEKAKEICDKCSGKNSSNKFLEYIDTLRNGIRNAEISDMVLKGINMKGTAEEEIEYFKLIEKGLKKAKINFEKISLGKDQNGLRTITLADIWTSEKQSSR